jgi:acetyl-CoA carboxylase carboxyltransferase component
MNRVTKMISKKLLLVLFLTTPVLNAGRGGSSFAGGMAGSMFGSMLGSAMTRPRSQTVVVDRSGGEVSRDEVARLERNLRDQLVNLEEVVRKDLNKLYDRIRVLESENKGLKDEIIEISREHEKIKDDLGALENKPPMLRM